MGASISPRVSELTDADLRRLVGATSLARGRNYARNSRVHDVQVRANGSQVSASVAGSGGHRYRTSLTFTVERGVTYLDNDCTCPIGGDCKHVAALAIVARASSAAAESDVGRPGRPQPRQVSQVPDWQSTLDAALTDEGADDPAGRPLALALCARVATSDGGPAQLTLEPRVMGARGDWIKSGASWNQVQYGYGQTFRRAHQLALQDIAFANGAAFYGNYAGSYRLSGLGARWFHLLTRARRAGVELIIDGVAGGSVVLAPEPAGVTVRVSPPRDGAAARLTVDLELPPGVPGDWYEINDSQHDVIGWVAIAAQQITLVRCDQGVLDPVQKRLLTVGQLTIPADDWGRFAVTQLPTLRQRVLVTSTDPDMPLPEPDPPRLVAVVRHLPGHRSQLAFGFSYAIPGAPAVLTSSDDQGSAMRDVDAERDLLTRFLDVIASDRCWVNRAPSPQLRPETSWSGLEVAELLELVRALEAHPDADVRVEGTPAEYCEAVDGPTIRVGTSDSDDGDWFDLSVQVSVGNEEVPLAALIAALAVGEPALLLDSGTWFSLDRPELHQLASVLAEARMLEDKPGSGLRLTPLHAGLWQELVSLGVVGDQSETWARRVGALTDEGLRDDIAVPETLDARLRPYQLDGYRWLSMLWQARLGGVLADDMGLGKTLQVLAMIERARVDGELEGRPVLIVCPTSVISTWVHEAATFCPQLRTVALTQTRAKAGASLEDAVASAEVVVTSYALHRLDADVFGSQPWSALVLDEAQFVKNHSTRGYVAARRTPADRTFVLTGTPLENSLMDLWSLLSLAAPGLYPRPERFKQHYQVPIELEGSLDMLATLRRRIRPLMLRRTKEQVAADLPPKQETVLSVRLAAKHRPIYERHLQRERQRVLGLVSDLDSHRIAIFRALTLLRQLSLDPGLVDEQYAGLASPAKVDLLVEHLKELAAEGHRALVFSQFTGFLRGVGERLARERIGFSYLDGRTRNRDRVIGEFRAGPNPVFLISLKAGGSGLTLTEADYVFILDPWWNPAAEMQAVDRAHRIGQQRPVNVYRMVSADTIEEKVVALQHKKRDLFAKVVDDGAVMSSSLTADDIRGLLDG